MIERECRCGAKFQAKPSDVKRGWAKACCKSHAAHSREKKLDRFGFSKGESGTFKSRSDDRAHSASDAGLCAVEDGWDGHKSAF